MFARYPTHRVGTARVRAGTTHNIITAQKMYLTCLSISVHVFGLGNLGQGIGT